MAIDLPGLSSTQGSGGRGNRVNNEQQNNATPTGGAGNAQQPSVNQGATDTVKISDAAQAIQSAAQDVRSEPDVNSDRVAQLKQAIGSGEYKVDAGRVAQGMLNFESLFN